jgi:hypothetical protein
MHPIEVFCHFSSKDNVWIVASDIAYPKTYLMVQAWLHVVVFSIRSSSVAWRSFVAQDMETRRDTSECVVSEWAAVSAKQTIHATNYCSWISKY